jgi:hypothetical protein
MNEETNYIGKIESSPRVLATLTGKTLTEFFSAFKYRKLVTIFGDVDTGNALSVSPSF